MNSFDLYSYFFAAANTGNISRAAEVLYTSQPVVSKHIARLEDELGVQLFVRTPRGVQLTEEGKILYEHVRAAFGCLEAGTTALDQQKSESGGHLRIGASTTLGKYLLLPYLKEYISRHPNVRISIQCQSTTHSLKALEQNQIDIGLIGRPERIGALKFFPMLRIEDSFVASPGYLSRFDAEEQRHLLTAKNSTVMLLDKENISRQYIDRYLEANHIYPPNLLEISTMDLIIEFAKIGMGIGCVIREFVQEELKQGTLVELPLHAPLKSRDVGFAVRNDRYMTTPLREMIEMLQIAQKKDDV